MSTRAVHLEMAHGLDADSCVSTITGFEQRRWVPAAYYSDWGTNFVEAHRELSECLGRLDFDRISDSASMRRVNWIFNPPGASHFGGAWESLVKSCK